MKPDEIEWISRKIPMPAMEQMQRPAYIENLDCDSLDRQTFLKTHSRTFPKEFCCMRQKAFWVAMMKTHGRPLSAENIESLNAPLLNRGDGLRENGYLSVSGAVIFLDAPLAPRPKHSLPPIWFESKDPTIEQPGVQV